MKNLILLVSLFLVSCTDSMKQLKRVGKIPPMSKVEVPVNQTANTVDSEKAYIAHVKKTNSLWKPGSTTFFRDNRAWNIGDIVKVVVEIKDSAKVNSATKQSRNSEDDLNVETLFNNSKNTKATVVTTPNASQVLQSEAASKLPIPLLQDTLLGTLVDLKSKYTHNGAGNINRQENVTTQIAANVMQVLPNGNLVIFGHQEVRINYELREIKVAGIIRPKDISATNAINLDQIAQARVSYGGRGVVSDVQNPKLGAQVLEIIKPF